MEKALPLEEHSIRQIYLNSTEPLIYKVPIYQRNYAWQEDEIRALIKDVYDSFHKLPQPIYYIGTLVTYKRGDNEFEVIDGQQRLTTIYIILKVLGQAIRNKLTYTARRVSAETIDKLPDFGEEYDAGIKYGYAWAEKAVKEIVSRNERDQFCTYFLDKVHIIHYRVPKDVDLNHYFEVMNSRGEQLEKHEIVKSKLSQELNTKEDLTSFSRIWEACSVMNVYIQQELHDEHLFTNNYEDFNVSNFDQIPRQNSSEGKDTIANLLSASSEKLDKSSNSRQNEMFQPIIDFPNFLLIVLKITLLKDYRFDLIDFTLDDKELLAEFEEALSKVDHKEQFVKIFAYNLLKAKYLLDNYVVHHDASSKEQTTENPWHLQRYVYQDKGNNKLPKNLDGDSDTQKELVQLLSMFEVSFTPKQRKNYLFYCLVHLFGNLDVNDYLVFLQQLASKYFFDVYLNISSLNERNQPKPNAFDSAIISDCEINLKLSNCQADYARLFNSIYKMGYCDIPLFVFNFTDYKIWKKYANALRGNKTRKGSSERKEFFESLGCSDFELDTFNNFYFSRTRKSLEHYYPQAKAVEDGQETNSVLSTKQINCFGNFAMIGAEANSSGSNWDPITKLDHYVDGKSDPISVASLKFKIMMQRCRDNQIKKFNDSTFRLDSVEWNFKDICVHQQKMLDIICDS